MNLIIILVFALFLTSCSSIRNGNGLIGNGGGASTGFIVIHEGGEKTVVKVGASR